MLLRVSGTRKVMARLRMPFVLLATVERLFTKCRAAGVSKFQALLDWRNTPSEGMVTSHAQRLLGRRCKTLLPTSGTLLTPEFSLVNDAAKLCARKERQGRYFNRGKHVLSPVQTGETIRVRSPSGTWRPAECLREVVPRSYEVLVDGAVRRRNRKDIWRTAERRNLPRKLNPLPKFKGLLLRRQVLFLKLLLLALRRHPLRLIVWMNPRHHLL